MFISQLIATNCKRSYPVTGAAGIQDAAGGSVGAGIGIDMMLPYDPTVGGGGQQPHPKYDFESMGAGYTSYNPATATGRESMAGDGHTLDDDYEDGGGGGRSRKKARRGRPRTGSFEDSDPDPACAGSSEEEEEEVRCLRDF